jgi:hypothetical protein
VIYLGSYHSSWRSETLHLTLFLFRVVQVKTISFLHKLRTEGWIPFQTLGFLTGATLTVIAFLTFSAKILSLNVIMAITQGQTNGLGRNHHCLAP